MSFIETLVLGAYLYITAVLGLVWRKIDALAVNHLAHIEALMQRNHEIIMKVLDRLDHDKQLPKVPDSYEENLREPKTED